MRLSDQDKELRAGMILAAKLRGTTIAEIERQFKVSRATVYRALSNARKSGIVAQAHDFITENLVPKALAAYDHILSHSDDEHLVKEVADKVLEGLGILGKHATINVVNAPATESFEEFRLAVTRRVTTTIPTGDEKAPLPEGNVVDGELAVPEVDSPPGGEGDGVDSVATKVLHPSLIVDPPPIPFLPALSCLPSPSPSPSPSSPTTTRQASVESTPSPIPPSS